MTVDNLLLTAFSITVPALVGWIVKQTHERNKLEKTHKDEIIKIMADYSTKVEGLLTNSTTAMVKVTNALENQNSLTDRILNRIK